jgi:hypothetical protein
MFAPAVTSLNRHADLAHLICDRHALHLQHFNLTKLQHHIFRFASLSSHLWSSRNGITLSQLVDHFSGDTPTPNRLC